MTREDWDKGVRDAESAVELADAERKAATRRWSEARKAFNAELVRRGKEIAGEIIGRKVVRIDPNHKAGRLKSGMLVIYDPEAGIPSPFAGGVGDVVVLSASGKKSELYRPENWAIEQAQKRKTDR